MALLIPPGVGFVRTSNAPVTAAPLTLAGWIKAASGGIGSFGVGDALGIDFFLLQSEQGSGTVGSCQNSTGPFGQCISTTLPPVATWFHGAAVFTSATSRATFLNGGSKGTDATSVTPIAGNIVQIWLGGKQIDGAWNNTSTGNVEYGEFGIWNAALTDAEVLALARGVNPTLVRPQNLVAYYPLQKFSPITANWYRNATARDLDTDPSGLGTVALATSNPPVQAPFSGVAQWQGTLTSTAPVILPGAAGAYTLTGSAAALQLGHVAAAGAYTLTGTAATLRLGHSAGAGAYTITGTAANFVATDNKVLPAAGGAYTLTGTAATFVATDNKSLVAAAGSYTITGQPASFVATANLVLPAAAGAYTITGANAAFQVGGNFVLPIDPGTYTVTGTAATFRVSDNKVLPAAAGAYAITGTAASFVITAGGGNVTLPAAGGAYVITGADATFVISAVAPPDTGGGYTGGRTGPLYRTRKLRKERRDELEELLELVRAQIPVEPDAPPPLLPSGLALTDLMERAQLTRPQRAIVRRAVVSDEEDDDEEAIALLLELIS